MKAAIVVGVLALPLAAGADEIYLRSGGHLSGLIVERRAEGIVVDVGPGRVTLQAQLVVRIVEGTPAFELFRERSTRLSPTDVKGWLDLALWARAHELLTQSRQALEQVLAVDPGNAVAHRELGHVLLDGRWMTAEEGYRARGYLYFEGNWVRPEERLALLHERAAEAQARQAELEAAARAREAEARARTAEAEALRAEAAMAGPTDGIPLALTYGSYPYGGYGPVVVGGYVGVGSFRSGHHGDGRGQGGGRGHAVGAGQAPRCERPPARATTPAPPARPSAPRSAPVHASAPVAGVAGSKGHP
jgi:hypothetical protein